MFGLAAVLFFSVTGITLNHPDWFFGERRAPRPGRGPDRPEVAAPRRPGRPARSEPDPSRQVAKLEVVEHLRKAHGDPRGPGRVPGRRERVHRHLQGARLRRRRLHRPRDGPLQPDPDRTTASSPSSTTCTRAATPARSGRWSSTSRPSLMTVISLTGLVLLFYLKLRRSARPGRGRRSARSPSSWRSSCSGCRESRGEAPRRSLNDHLWRRPTSAS